MAVTTNPANKNLLDPLKKALHDAVVHAVNAGANRTYERAVERAPVRKVFRAGKQSSRLQTQAEARAEVPLRLKLATSEEQRKEIRTNPARIRVATGRRSALNAFNPRHPGFGSSFLKARDEDPFINARDVKFSTSGKPRLEHGEIKRRAGKSISSTSTGVAKALSARGRYELESGRGVYRPPGGGQATLGGRLRREIEVGPLKDNGLRITRQVVSPTRYARYVEMGTRHAKAQPYMRPALAATREEFRKIVIEQLRKAKTQIRRPKGAGGFAKEATPAPKAAPKAKRTRAKTTEIIIPKDIQDLFGRLGG